MSAKHTPEPWIKERGSLIGSNGQPVVAASIGLGLGPDCGDGNRVANARLIAAAPELLEIAKAILAEDMLQYLPAEYIAKVRAVIAKATGGAA